MIQTAAHPVVQTTPAPTEIIYVGLDNGDEVTFLNGVVVWAKECWEKGDGSPRAVAERLQMGMGVAVEFLDIETPEDDEWTYDDVYVIAKQQIARTKAVAQADGERRVNVVVIGTDAHGAPAFHFFSMMASPAMIDAGEPQEKARDEAEATRSIKPIAAFDVSHPAAAQVLAAARFLQAA